MSALKAQPPQRHKKLSSIIGDNLDLWDTARFHVHKKEMAFHSDVDVSYPTHPSLCSGADIIIAYNRSLRMSVKKDCNLAKSQSQGPNNNLSSSSVI